MYEIHILEIFDPKANMEPRAKYHFEYETSSHAELRALRWLVGRPNDIVMLVEPT